MKNARADVTIVLPYLVSRAASPGAPVVMHGPLENQISRLIRWQNGQAPGPGPFRITIFPTNICNIQCKHCWQRWAEYDKTYKSEMSDERLLRLVDEAAALDARDWYFVGGGDPMGRSKVVMQMMKKIRDYGMNGGLHTNGTLFKPWMLEQMVDTGWAYLNVSLDGPTAEINDFVRSKGFDKAVHNLKEIVRLKHERGASQPRVTLFVTVTNLTYDKIDQFAELAHSIGPGVGTEISGLIVEEEGCAQFELSPEQKQSYPEHLRKGIARAQELGVPNNFERYLNEELIHDGMDMHRGFKPVSGRGITSAMCYEPWTSMAIMPDGKLGPCCAMHSEHALSVKDRTLEEVWNGAYMTEVRAGMLNGQPPDYCRRCPSNIYVLKERVRSVASRRLDQEFDWRSLSALGRLRYVATRSAHSLRHAGLHETVRRGMRWAQIRRESVTREKVKT